MLAWYAVNGSAGAGRLLHFVVWTFAIIMFLASLNKEALPKIAANGRSIPAWLSHGWGAVLICFLVWHGWIGAAIAMLIWEIAEAAIFYETNRLLNPPLKTTPQWKTIDSAPKDGTRILVTDGDMLEVCEWGETRCLNFPGNMGWRYGGGDDYSSYNQIYYPTHWLPLPSLPNAHVDATAHNKNSMKTNANAAEVEQPASAGCVSRLVGLLVFAGDLEVNGEEISGCAVDIDRATLISAKSLPMYQRCVIIPAAELVKMQAVVNAAQCIHHWHDRDNGGMVVSAEHVQNLWAALHDLEANAGSDAPGAKDQSDEK